MTDIQQPPSSESTLNFAMTHCRTCKAGWTRIGAEDAWIIVCLLDREIVMPGMRDCDRFELDPQKAAIYGAPEPEAPSDLPPEPSPEDERPTFTLDQS